MEFVYSKKNIKYCQPYPIILVYLCNVFGMKIVKFQDIQVATDSRKYQYGSLNPSLVRPS